MAATKPWRQSQVVRKRRLFARLLEQNTAVWSWSLRYFWAVGPSGLQGRPIRISSSTTRWSSTGTGKTITCRTGRTCGPLLTCWRKRSPVSPGPRNLRLHAPARRSKSAADLVWPAWSPCHGACECSLPTTTRLPSISSYGVRPKMGLIGRGFRHASSIGATCPTSSVRSSSAPT